MTGLRQGKIMFVIPAFYCWTYLLLQINMRNCKLLYIFSFALFEIVRYPEMLRLLPVIHLAHLAINLNAQGMSRMFTHIAGELQCNP
ncbi:hypothetical protein V5799_004699 [Amblyomma americanum]|uniref:Uncharacterized protein n=1 Tax=Amblyomma americanum TaxID=6943 RepID=A0AAQ4D5C9_AMBAM